MSQQKVREGLNLLPQDSTYLFVFQIETFRQFFLFLNLILFQFLNMKNAFWYWIFQKRIEFYVFEDLSLQGRSFGSIWSWIYEFQSLQIFKNINSICFRPNILLSFFGFKQLHILLILSCNINITQYFMFNEIARFEQK